MRRKNKKTVSYYGREDNYIHLKFGDCRKMYNFTEEFREQYPEFAQEYAKYFCHEQSKFRNVLQVVSYVYNNHIPVHLYFNFTDTPVRSRDEVTEWILSNNDIKELY